MRLRQWIDEFDSIFMALGLAHCLIYDNSKIPHPLKGRDLNDRISFFHDESNGGTRAAYLYALQMAKKKGYKWLLLLDHDTDLPENFFFAANKIISENLKNNTICAVVPSVFDQGNQISPSRMTNYGRGYVKREAWKIKKKNTTLTAIASASLISTDAMTAALPIPADLTLDYLDHWLFRELQHRGGNIAVSTARVEHSLSLQSMKTISVDRYRAILAAELIYLKSDPSYPLVLHLGWHLVRTIKLMLVTRRFDLVLACVCGLFYIARIV